MRLHELSFPIAILWPEPIGLWGGKNAGLSRWSSYFAMGYDKEFLNGAFDDATVFDAAGRRFEVAEIALRKPDWWNMFLRSAGGFFLPDREKRHFASVDMELRQTGHFTERDLSNYLSEIALANPRWWEHHSSETEIASMFEGCSTYQEIIDNIGVLGPDGPQNWPQNYKGRSTKTVDFR